MNIKTFLMQSDKAVLIACLLGMMLFTCLGTWQGKRLLWKQGLISQLENRLTQAPIPLSQFAEQYSARDDDDVLSQNYATQRGEFTPLSLRGEFLPHHFYLLNRSMDSKAGVNWLQVFANEDGRNILINRGFIPFDLKDAVKPEELSNDTQALQAMVRLSRGRTPFLPENVPEENIWFYIDLAKMSALSGVKLVDYYGMAGATPEGYDYPKAYDWYFDIPNYHFQYMVTWFSFAIITLVIGIYYQFRLIKSGA